MSVFVWICLIAMKLFTKRKQKFAGSFARINSILCELVVVISD